MAQLQREWKWRYSTRRTRMFLDLRRPSGWSEGHSTLGKSARNGDGCAGGGLKEAAEDEFEREG